MYSIRNLEKFVKESAGEIRAEALDPGLITGKLASHRITNGMILSAHQVRRLLCKNTHLTELFFQAFNRDPEHTDIALKDCG